MDAKVVGMDAVARQIDLDEDHDLGPL